VLRIAAVNQDPGIAPGRAKGAAVHLVAMREAFAGLGAAVEPFDTPDGQALAAALEARHRREPFDMVYERYALGQSTAARFARYKGVPLALEVNAPLARERALYRSAPETRQERENDRFLFGEARCVVAVSGAVAEYAIGRGARPGHVTICPNGIDTERFNPQVDAAPLRRKVVQKGAFIVGFHGRERPWHGFGRLLSVFRRLLERGLDTHLLVVGEGEFAGLECLPAGRFTRMGWQPHERMPEVVAAFDALPLTYRPEAPCYFSPLKLMEAMACGVVPVVPDLGDLPLVVEDGRTGLVYPAGDLRVLESQLAGLASDRAVRRELGANAAGRAARHSWSRVAEHVLEMVFGARGAAEPGHAARSGAL